LIAGVIVPDSPLITEVLEYAQKLSEPYLFNHAMRSWLFAAKIGQIKAIDCDHEVPGKRRKRSRAADVGSAAQPS
jgi:hypothetical protein